MSSFSRRVVPSYLPIYPRRVVDGVAFSLPSLHFHLVPFLKGEGFIGCPHQLHLVLTVPRPLHNSSTWYCLSLWYSLCCPFVMTK